MGKKIFERISETLGLYEDEEVKDEELEEEVVEKEAEPPKKVVPVKKTTKPVPVDKQAPAAEETEEHKGKKSFFSRHHNNKKSASKTISMPLSKKQIKVVVIEPASFDDSQKVADYLRNNEPVVVNFETTDKLVKKRMTDFISGTIYALGGSLKQIGANILVCAPKNVDIDAGANLYTDKGGSTWKK